MTASVGWQQQAALDHLLKRTTPISCEAPPTSRRQPRAPLEGCPTHL